jgi:hypothetical protein
VGERGRPLVVTRDEELLDEVLRIASAGGVEVTVAVDAVAAEDAWASAPLVVVGADRAGELARRRLPMRMGVLVVAGPGTAEDPALWSSAEVLHAEHVLVLPDARSWLTAAFAEHGPARDPSARASTVVVVPGSGGAAAGELALAFAATARRQGYGALLLSPTTACSASPPFEPVAGARGSLGLLWLGRSGEPNVPPEAMAAALRAGRAERDLVVVDLPYGLDDASLLALTGADRAYLVVIAEVRACAAAARIAAAVRRHCPALALVVRSTGSRGLRSVEVAQALDLPLVGVLPHDPPIVRSGHASLPDDGPLARLSRRLLVDLELRGRPTLWERPTPDAARVP